MKRGDGHPGLRAQFHGYFLNDVLTRSSRAYLAARLLDLVNVRDAPLLAADDPK